MPDSRLAVVIWQYRPRLGVERSLTEPGSPAADRPLNALVYAGIHNGCHRANILAACVKPWRYSHLYFLDQLGIGVRHLELDVWYS